MLPLCELVGPGRFESSLDAQCKILKSDTSGPITEIAEIAVLRTEIKAFRQNSVTKPDGPPMRQAGASSLSEIS